jgi:hypothetical protein
MSATIKQQLACMRARAADWGNAVCPLDRREIVRIDVMILIN